MRKCHVLCAFFNRCLKEESACRPPLASTLPHPAWHILSFFQPCSLLLSSFQPWCTGSFPFFAWFGCLPLLFSSDMYCYHCRFLEEVASLILYYWWNRTCVSLVVSCACVSEWVCVRACMRACARACVCVCVWQLDVWNMTHWAAKYDLHVHLWKLFPVFLVVVFVVVLVVVVIVVVVVVVVSCCQFCCYW